MYYDNVRLRSALARLAATSPLQYRLQTDGLALAMLAVSALTRAGISAADWRAAMPETHRVTRTVGLPPVRRGGVLRALAEENDGAELGGGIRFPRERGWAWVCPDEAQGTCRIVTEGADAEFAAELCDFYEAAVRRLAGEAGERESE